MTALQTLLNQELNHRIVEVMAAGVAQVVFGDPGLVGDYRHLEELRLRQDPGSAAAGSLALTPKEAPRSLAVL